LGPDDELTEREPGVARRDVMMGQDCESLGV
jgi:hypothetical protein